MSFDIADYSYSRNRAPAAVAQSRYFTVKARGQTIGVPVDCVKTIFHLDNLTRMPLAPREVAGLTNLRGRIVTALYLDRCLWLDEAATRAQGLAVGIEHGGEDYALLVDETEDVVACNEHDRIPCPGHIDPRLSELMAGCYPYDGGFLSILNVDAMLRRLGRLSEASPREGRSGNSNNSNRGASS